MSASVRPSVRPSVDATTGQTAWRILMKFGMRVPPRVRTVSAEFRVDPTTTAPPSGDFEVFCVRHLCASISTKRFDRSAWNFTGVLLSMSGWHMQGFVMIRSLGCPLVAIFCRFFTDFRRFSVCMSISSKRFDGSSWNFAHAFLSMNGWHLRSFVTTQNTTLPPSGHFWNYF